MTSCSPRNKYRRTARALYLLRGAPACTMRAKQGQGLQWILLAMCVIQHHPHSHLFSRCPAPGPRIKCRPSHRRPIMRVCAWVLVPVPMSTLDTPTHADADAVKQALGLGRKRPIGSRWLYSAPASVTAHDTLPVAGRPDGAHKLVEERRALANSGRDADNRAPSYHGHSVPTPSRLPYRVRARAWLSPAATVATGYRVPVQRLERRGEEHVLLVIAVPM
eukprot:scaffold943_cov112-Isochrysis_galbana.AAC.2